MIGLGVMGRNLVLNLSEHGFCIAGYDLDPSKIAALREEAPSGNIRCARDIREFVALLRRPRAVMILVPAGPPVDSVIGELIAHLEAGDIVIDGGNSHFKDTDVRARTLQAKGLRYLGVGVSGGEEGARRGPSLMAGGAKDAYENVRALFEAAAARVDGEPCVACLGPSSAGHYVKMVHNGIEYGLMELLAETYDLLKRGLGLNDDELHAFYADSNRGDLAGYLVEITGRIFSRQDDRTGQRLIDEIRDVAQQNGTGMWTSESALELGVPVPTIDAAVAMRNLSVLDQERVSAGDVFRRPAQSFCADREGFQTQLRSALFAGNLIVFAQGMALLKAASKRYAYDLDLSVVSRIWRGGCIIRTDALGRIADAYRARPEPPNLILDPVLAKALLGHERDLRDVVVAAVQLGLPAPALMTALGYLDSYRSAWLPANLIQAQRDYFGAHAYERIDARGTFHTEWNQS